MILHAGARKARRGHVTGTWRRLLGKMCVMEGRIERLRTICYGEPSILLLDLEVIAQVELGSVHVLAALSLLRNIFVG